MVLPALISAADGFSAAVFAGATSLSVQPISANDNRILNVKYFITNLEN
jgi:hypothetical protein